MASIAKTGKVMDANKMVNPDWLKQNYNQGYLDTATVADQGRQPDPGRRLPARERQGPGLVSQEGL